MGCCLLTSASVASQRATCKGPLKVRIDHGAALALTGICLAVSAAGRAEGGQEALCLQVSGATRTRISGDSSVSLASSLQAQKQTLCQSSLTFLYAGRSRFRGKRQRLFSRLTPGLENRNQGALGDMEHSRWQLRPSGGP